MRAIIVGEGLSVLEPYLPPEQLNRVLDAVLQWKDGYDRSKALQRLVSHLPPEMLDKAVDAVMQWEEYRGEVLAKAAPLLQVDRLHQVVAAISDNLSDLDQMLPILPEAERRTAVTNAYGTAFRIRDNVAFTAAFSVLASHLPKKEATQAIALAETAAHEAADRTERALSLLLLSCSACVSERRADELLAEALECFKKEDDPDARVGLGVFSCCRRGLPILTPERLCHQ